MNFVAHLFLADPTDEARIGSVLADFTAGRIEDLQQRFGIAIAEGIRQHRAVDRFTDTHPTVLHSIACLEPEHGMFAGIIVDVVYDHFLLKHWTRFTTTPLSEFIETVHTSLRRDDWEFPPRYRYVIPRMVESHWFLSYGTIEGVAQALRLMNLRFERETSLSRAGESLQRCYQVLEDDFLRFFPELVAFARKYEERKEE